MCAVMLLLPVPALTLTQDDSNGQLEAGEQRGLVGAAPQCVNADYESEIQSARRDFNDNTDLAVYWCSWVCNGNIRHNQADYGDVGWAARTRRHGNPVTHAYVDWNGDYSQDSFTALRLARHEMGHALGLDHVPCGGDGPYEPTIYSIMGCPESGVNRANAF